ncbi:Glyoxalase/bleomycin resistance protein/dioxygenase [Candidatus Sulfopaludibacter sp. SbA3]|nr:Glyoxalase/bleomycin resistance protein/dioxygenase [Candidatus Sulfopaludibacter sp. SbA3]
MVKGIEHTAIASPDPQRLAQWYVDNLDFVINYRSGSSKTVFVKAANGSMIEMIESRNAPITADMRDAGLRHLAIEVSDFGAAYTRLSAAGVKFLTDPETKGGNTVAFFTDCDGNILHLVHRQAPLP